LQFTIFKFLFLKLYSILPIFQISFNNFLMLFSPFFNFLMVTRQKHFWNFPTNSSFWTKECWPGILWIFNKTFFKNSLF